MAEAETTNLQPNDHAMRIFLSYGHDSNEELVLRIKANLEKRGHDVWFDKSEIRFGDDWRREITDGIINSNRVLSFLSKYSTRDPGVCLDELAIAIGVKGGNIQTILVESEADVKPPPSIGHIQWLDMHDWKERRAVDEVVWEKWYQEKLDQIIRVIESDESRRFAGEIRVLEELLKPISSDSRMAELLRKPLVGRTWLFETLDRWRNTDHASRLFWIMGAPGVGKSAFAAHLAHYGRDKVIAVQFCEYDKPDHHDARRIVRTLAFQIATRLPDYRKLLLLLPEITDLDRKNPAELFDYLLANPLKLSIRGGRERYLIVIDALDEAGEAGRNPLVEILALNAPRLPDWISLVATSRPESAVVGPLQGLNPFVLDTESDKNRDDIRDYLHNELAAPLQGRRDADSLVEQILEKSEGVFLYAERFCDDVRQSHLSLDNPAQFPQGLGGIFYQYFQRQFPDEEKYLAVDEPAIGTIIAAREPLPVQILQKIFGWNEVQFGKWHRPVTSLFPLIPEPDKEVIKPYHKSVADWFLHGNKAAEYRVNFSEGNHRLADFCWQEYQLGTDQMSYYSLEHGPSHFIIEEYWQYLSIVLCNVNYVERCISFGFSDRLVKYYDLALSGLKGDKKKANALHKMKKYVIAVIEQTRDWVNKWYQLNNLKQNVKLDGQLDALVAIFQQNLILGSRYFDFYNRRYTKLNLFSIILITAISIWRLYSNDKFYVELIGIVLLISSPFILQMLVLTTVGRKKSEEFTVQTCLLERLFIFNIIGVPALLVGEYMQTIGIDFPKLTQAINTYNSVSKTNAIFAEKRTEEMLLQNITFFNKEWLGTQIAFRSSKKKSVKNVAHFFRTTFLISISIAAILVAAEFGVWIWLNCFSVYLSIGVVICTGFIAFSVGSRKVNPLNRDDWPDELISLANTTSERLDQIKNISQLDEARNVIWSYLREELTWLFNKKYK